MHVMKRVYRNDCHIFLIKYEERVKTSKIVIRRTNAYRVSQKWHHFCTP